MYLNSIREGCILWAIATCATVASVATNGSSPLPNGSFEIGTAEPEGWKLSSGALWATGPSHSGTRSVEGVTTREENICESQTVWLKAGADYRLSGWVNCTSGSARLGVDLLDEQERVISQYVSPRAALSSGWVYVATEFAVADIKSSPRKLQAGQSPITNGYRARVWFHLKGRAKLDDVSLTPLATSFMGNKGFEADQRGRIGFWSEEKDDALLEGRRGGVIRPDPDNKREGKSSVLLNPSADWIALSSINYGLAPWTECYEFSTWARCEAAGIAHPPAASFSRTSGGTTSARRAQVVSG